MTAPLTVLYLEQRRNKTTLADLPATLVPTSVEDAYAIQSETVRALGAVGAWKVGPKPAEGEPFCSPILAENVYPDGVHLRSADFPGLGIEVEVAVKLGVDLTGKEGGYSQQDMREAIGSVHVAIELLASRHRDRSKVPQLATIADLQNNGGIVLGAPVKADVLPEFGNQAMSLSFDGAVVQTSEGAATTDNVLASLAWLADHAAARGMPLKAGDVVITGARIGPIPFEKGEVVARADGLGSVSVSFGAD